jgi:hypothetical protein
MKRTSKIVPLHYGCANGYGWSNDPFSDPMEKKEKKAKAKKERKLKERAKA